MIPAVVLVETVDEVDGGLIVLRSGDHKKRICFLVADHIDVFRKVWVLLVKIIARANDKAPFRVIVFVSAFGIPQHRIAVVEKTLAYSYLGRSLALRRLTTLRCLRRVTTRAR